MKKLIFILLVGLFTVSCDTAPAPLHVLNDNGQKNKMIENVETIGDTIVSYEQDNIIYYKNNKGQYYSADITSGTDLTTVSALYYALTIVLMLIVGIFLITMILES
jgi:ethanolamine ammonia-lyase large subunit